MPECQQAHTKKLQHGDPSQEKNINRKPKLIIECWMESARNMHTLIFSTRWKPCVRTTVSTDEGMQKTCREKSFLTSEGTR